MPKMPKEKLSSFFSFKKVKLDCFIYVPYLAVVLNLKLLSLQFSSAMVILASAQGLARAVRIPKFYLQASKLDKCLMKRCLPVDRHVPNLPIRFNPITYGILRFHQPPRGRLFGLDPENKITVNVLI